MLDIYIRSDLVPDGTDECGTPKERTMYYIIAESSTGQRLRLTSISLVNKELSDEQCQQYLQITVDKITNHLAAGGKLNPDHWTEIDPCYGSQRYMDLDSTGFFYLREKREEQYRN